MPPWSSAPMSTARLSTWRSTSRSTTSSILRIEWTGSSMPCGRHPRPLRVKASGASSSTPGKAEPDEHDINGGAPPGCVRGQHSGDGRGPDDRCRRRGHPGLALRPRGCRSRTRRADGDRAGRRRAPHPLRPHRRLARGGRRPPSGARPLLAPQVHPARQRAQGPSRRGCHFRRHLRRASRGQRQGRTRKGEPKCARVRSVVQGRLPRGDSRWSSLW